nr:hypothetical protein [Klebsiella pneumoniae]
MNKTKGCLIANFATVPKKRLRSLKDLDKSALALASACSYLLKEETPDESIRAEVFSYI